MQAAAQRPSARWMNGAPQAAATALFFAYVLVLLGHRSAPLLGDLSNWAYSGELLARHMHGLPDVAHTLKHYPVPNSILTLALGLLCYALPLDTAVKILLILYLALCWYAVRALARAAQSSPLIWLIAPAGFFLSVNFWYGFLAFESGVALLFLLLAHLLTCLRTGREPNCLKTGTLLVLLFFTHMVPCTFGCLLLLLFALQTGRHAVLRVLIPVALLLTWYATGRVLGGNVDQSALPPLASHNMVYIVTYKMGTLLKSFGMVNPLDNTRHPVLLLRFGWTAYLALLGTNLVVSAAALLVFWRSFVGISRSHANFAWLAATVALLVYPFLPQALLGVSDPGSRVLQTVLWPALFLAARREAVTPELKVMAAGSVLLAAMGFGLFALLPWHIPTVADPLWESSPVQTIGGAPYAYAAHFLRDAERRNWEDPVFPTALFNNRHAYMP